MHIFALVLEKKVVWKNHNFISNLVSEWLDFVQFFIKTVKILRGARAPLHPPPGRCPWTPPGPMRPLDPGIKGGALPPYPPPPGRCPWTPTLEYTHFTLASSQACMEDEFAINENLFLYVFLLVSVPRRVNKTTMVSIHVHRPTLAQIKQIS